MMKLYSYQVKAQINNVKNIKSVRLLCDTLSAEPSDAYQPEEML